MHPTSSAKHSILSCHSCLAPSLSRQQFYQLSSQPHCSILGLNKHRKSLGWVFIYVPADRVPRLLSSLWPTLRFQGCGSWGGLMSLVPYTAVSPPLLLPEALPRETSPTLALNHTLLLPLLKVRVPLIPTAPTLLMTTKGNGSRECSLWKPSKSQTLFWMQKKLYLEMEGKKKTGEREERHASLSPTPET